MWSFRWYENESGDLSTTGIKQKETQEEEVRKLCNMGDIRRSSSPWAARMLLVKKPEDGSWRPCIDYRGLNSITIKRLLPIITPNWWCLGYSRIRKDILMHNFQYHMQEPPLLLHSWWNSCVTGPIKLVSGEGKLANNCSTGTVAQRCSQHFGCSIWWWYQPICRGSGNGRHSSTSTDKTLIGRILCNSPCMGFHYMGTDKTPLLFACHIKEIQEDEDCVYIIFLSPNFFSFKGPNYVLVKYFLSPKLFSLLGP